MKLLFGLTHKQILVVVGGSWAMFWTVDHFTSFMWGVAAEFLWMVVMYLQYFNRNAVTWREAAQDETEK